MAKLFASEMSVHVCEEAIQIHRWIRLYEGYPAAEVLGDSKLCTIGEGTSEIQRIIMRARFCGRTLAGSGKAS